MALQREHRWATTLRAGATAGAGRWDPLAVGTAAATGADAEAAVAAAPGADEVAAFAVAAAAAGPVVAAVAAARSLIPRPPGLGALAEDDDVLVGALGTRLPLAAPGGIADAL